MGNTLKLSGKTEEELHLELQELREKILKNYATLSANAMHEAYQKAKDLQAEIHILQIKKHHETKKKTQP